MGLRMMLLVGGPVPWLVEVEATQAVAEAVVAAVASILALPEKLPLWEPIRC